MLKSEILKLEKFTLEVLNLEMFELEMIDWEMLNLNGSCGPLYTVWACLAWCNEDGFYSYLLYLASKLVTSLCPFCLATSKSEIALSRNSSELINK